jgi:hypothetical protein
MMDLSFVSISTIFGTEQACTCCLLSFLFSSQSEPDATALGRLTVAQMQERCTQLLGLAGTLDALMCLNGHALGEPHVCLTQAHLRLPAVASAAGDGTRVPAPFGIQLAHAL